MTRASFHVYAVCWNEARLLPAFLHHYRYADRIVVLDNESDDGSGDIVLAAGREVSSFSTGGTLDDLTNMGLKNTVWKQSRGAADWVVVQDLDEFVHFPRHPEDLRAGFAEMSAHGCVAAMTVAYDMYSSDADWQGMRMDQSVVTQVTQGKRVTERNYDKVLAFKPGAVTETNYSPGAHFWDPPDELVMAPESLRPLNLHFKHLGLEYELARRIAMGNRLSPANLEHGYGTNYRRTEGQHQFTVVQTYSDASVVDVGSIMFPPPWAVVTPCAGVSIAVLTGGAHDRIPGMRSALALAAWCSRGSGSGFLDLGADAGIHSFVALARAASRVVSVERRPAVERRLRCGLQANGWSDDRRLSVQGSATPATAKYDWLPEFADCRRIAVRIGAAGHGPESGLTHLLRDPRVDFLLVELDPSQRPHADLASMLGELHALGFRVASCDLRDSQVGRQGAAGELGRGPLSARISAWMASSFPGIGTVGVAFALRQQQAVEITMQRQ